MTYPNYPMVAIGGIQVSNVYEVLRSGANGIAVISAVSQAKDVRAIIQQFKSVMSISDIQSIMNPITDKYFGKKDEHLNLTDIYNEVFSLEHQETKNIMKDLVKKFNKSMQTFENVSEEESALLQRFTLICMLSYDIYIKKSIIEGIIDQINTDQLAENSKNTTDNHTNS